MDTETMNPTCAEFLLQVARIIRSLEPEGIVVQAQWMGNESSETMDRYRLAVSTADCVFWRDLTLLMFDGSVLVTDPRTGAFIGAEAIVTILVEDGETGLIDEADFTAGLLAVKRAIREAADSIGHPLPVTD